MACWLNGTLTKQQDKKHVDKLTNEQNLKLSEWKVDKMASWQNGMLTKWQDD